MSTSPTTPTPPDSVCIIEFPCHIGGCAACSEDLDHGCSAIPVNQGYVHEDCWNDYLTLISSSFTPTAAS